MNRLLLLTVLAGFALPAVAAHQPFDARAWLQGGHAGPATAVAVSPDGACIATGSEDATVKIWRASDGALLRTLAGSRFQVTSLAFGPGGTNLAAGYYDGAIRLWTVTNGTLVRTFNLSWQNSEIGVNYTNNLAQVRCLAFAPNGLQIASGGGDRFTRIWRVSDGSLVYNGVKHDGVVLSAAFAPDGSVLVLGGEDRKIVILRTNDWATLNSYYHSSNVTALCFSPNGATLVSGSLDRTVVFRRRSDWGIDRTLTNSSGVTALAFGAGGQSLFTGDQSGTIESWSAAAGWTLARSWPAHSGPVLGLACTADNSVLVSGGDDHRVQLWQTADGALLGSLTGQSGSITRACVSPDGQYVAGACQDGSLWLRSAETGAAARFLVAQTNQVGAIAFSPDATLLVSGGGCLDNTLCIWRCSDGALLNRFIAATNGITAVAVSPDGHTVATAGDRSEQVIRLWSIADGSLVQTLPGHTNGTATLAFAPDGRHLASGGLFAGGTIKLWDLGTGSAVEFTGHTNSVQALAIDPAGAYVASAGRKDGLIRIWQVSGGALLQTLSMTEGARSLAFSPDGTFLAAAGSDSVRYWQAGTWQSLWSWTNEMSGVNSLGFSPNGTFFTFGREDGTVGRAWNPMASPIVLTLAIDSAENPESPLLQISNPGWSPYLTVQASSGGNDWVTLTNLATTTNLVLWPDPGAAVVPTRFYRVGTPE
ncbi:MAG: WD40 repeat domain-containing protein [Verrucomicrobiota bacterium]